MSRRKSTGKTKQGKSGKGKKRQGKRIHINKYADKSQAAKRFKADQEKGFTPPIPPPEIKPVVEVRETEQPHTNMPPYYQRGRGWPF